MNLIAYFKYKKLIRSIKPKRYKVLFTHIYNNRSVRIVELGVYKGIHAKQMIRTASVHHSIDQIEYYGFDLFEDLNNELLELEKSKMPPSHKDVLSMLNRTGARIQLIKGNTLKTLPEHGAKIGIVDFIFIDGGHSIETITSDWQNVQCMMDKNTIVIFDDYYMNTNSEMDGAGCQTLIDNLDRRKYDVKILDTVDSFKKEWGNLKVKMVRVRKTSS